MKKPNKTEEQEAKEFWALHIRQCKLRKQADAAGVIFNTLRPFEADAQRRIIKAAAILLGVETP